MERHLAAREILGFGLQGAMDRHPGEGQALTETYNAFEVAAIFRAANIRGRARREYRTGVEIKRQAARTAYGV